MAAESATSRLALRIFLASLSVLFAASMVGHLVVRLRSQQWRPAGAPGLPSELWLSTAILVILSGILVVAVRRVRKGDRVASRRLLSAALGLGLAFIASQLKAWTVMASSGVALSGSLYGFTFYVLTALHALHVLGGVLPLLTAARTGSLLLVELTSTYWHFLFGVWLVMFAVLAI